MGCTDELSNLAGLLPEGRIILTGIRSVIVAGSVAVEINCLDYREDGTGLGVGNGAFYPAPDGERLTDLGEVIWEGERSFGELRGVVTLSAAGEVYSFDLSDHPVRLASLYRIPVGQKAPVTIYLKEVPIVEVCSARFRLLAVGRKSY